MSDSEDIQDYDSSEQEEYEQFSQGEYSEAEGDEAYPEGEDLYDNESEDDVEQRLEEEKEQLMANEAWGNSKHNFYAREDEEDSSQQDGDELDEAKRLQAIRAKKLQKQQKYAVEESESDSAVSEDKDDDSDKASEQEETDTENEAFGDKIFGAKIGKKGDSQDKLVALKTDKLKEIRELVDDMKGVIASLDYDIEFPDTEEFDTSNGFVSFTKLLTEFIKKFACQGNKTLIKRNKKVIDFLKVKEQIVLNYCLYMNYYLLGQAKLLSDSSKAINLQENEVLKKLTYYRTLIKQIEPIDAEIKSELQAVNIEDVQVPSDEEIGELDDELEDEAEDFEDEEGEMQQEGEQDFDQFSDEEGEFGAEGEESEVPEDLENSEEKLEKETMKELAKTKLSKGKITSEPKKEAKADKTKTKQEAPVIKAYRDESGIQDTEVKEMNKVLDKLFKKKKKVDNKKLQKGNVDDLVSEEEDRPKKWQLQKKRQKVNIDDEPEPEFEDTEQFGGFNKRKQKDEAAEDEGADEEPNEEELRRRELKKQRKEQLEAELERKSAAINRNVHRTIMKGKGLYRKRPKLYKNPRIKHKIKYQRALTKRKRMVQEHKGGPQAKYAGELTGIRSNLIKSTKF
jgi:U3 small nucleolar RNA-associated protein 3